MLHFDIEEISYVLGENSRDVIADLGFESVVPKTGIFRVHETSRVATELATEALSKLFEKQPSLPKDIDCLICVSQSPEDYLPGMACRLQESLGLHQNLLALDVSQGCSGFVAALSVAVRLLDAFRQIVIVCTDTYRSKIRKDDRSTSAVFSDAASATMISRGGRLSIVGESHFTDGSGRKFLNQPISREADQSRLFMSGADVLLFTQRVVPKEIERALNSAGLAVADVTNWYLHQASRLVLDSLESRVKPRTEFLRNIETVGNAVSSSIPILLAEDLSRISTGYSVLSGFGVGLSASTLVLSASNTA